MSHFFNAQSTPGVIGLPKRQVLALEGRKGTRIASRRGHLWITQDGDRRDVVLADGQGHVLDLDGPVLVQALDAAVVSVEPALLATAQRASLWQRLAQAAFSA